MGSLYKIQPDVQSTAEAIAAALNVETEIIDDEGTVLGATGRIRGELLTKRSDIYVTLYVIEHKRPLVLNTPGHHKICQPCYAKNDCFFTAGIYYPITIKGICHGVISLVGFNEHQKTILLNNETNFIEFIGKMADMLSTKLQQAIITEELFKTNQYMEAIINSVHEGIISCDGSGIVTHFNQTAERNYGISNLEAIGQPISKVLPSALLNKALTEGKSFYEEKIQCNNKDNEPISLISNAMIIKNNNAIIGGVESFSDESKIFRVAYRLSNSDNSTVFDNIIGTSAIINKIKQSALKVAHSSSTVLITGESGTGKELFARAIHGASHKSKGPFVPVNCSAIPDSLLESELFGYEKGAFTGARTEGKLGKFELANEGTIFLDEIGDMPIYLQVKILRVLQDKMVQRVGGTKNIHLNARVIAATNKNLKDEIAKHNFREDLYYRINVIPLTIPPLRERKEDISVLIKHFCLKYANILNTEIRGLSKEAMDILLKYKWPGNVRELENAIEYAINFCMSGDTITKEYLPTWLINNPEIDANKHQDFKEKLITSEKQILLEELETLGDSLNAKKQIAKKLGISLPTLYRKLRKCNLE